MVDLCFRKCYYEIAETQVSFVFEEVSKVIDYSKLLGKMREKGETIGSLSQKIGISSNSLSNKLHGRSQFVQEEIVAICEVLLIDKEEIPIYFFTEKLAISQENEG